MTRRLSQPYACPLLERLCRQLMFAPPERRTEQVRRAERLHDQVEPEVEYPYEFIAYRITGYRSQEEADTLLPGRVILPDLRLLIDTLSRSVSWPADAAEGVESARELAARLNVSTKTVTRWRRAGLRWRWMGGDDPRTRRLMFPRVGVDRFLAGNAKRVDRAARFTRMTAGQRAKVLARARRIAEAADVSLNRVATHLALRTGRAVETIRLLLEQHDRDHADDPIFVDRSTPLTVRQKRVIARAYGIGVSVGKMARHFRRTRATIYRAIYERRAAALRQAPITYVLAPTFTRIDADEVILRPEPLAGDGTEATAPARAPLDDLPEPLRPLFQQPVLDSDRQRSLLVRYNYLKYKADRFRGGLDRLEPRVAQLDQIEACLAQAAAISDRVLLANAPVLLSTARRHLIDQTEPSPNRLLELLEQGQEVLIQAVETYDAARGQSFEAYLTWMLMRRFATRDAQPRPKALRRPAPAAMLPRLRRALAGTGLQVGAVPSGEILVPPGASPRAGGSQPVRKPEPTGEPAPAGKSGPSRTSARRLRGLNGPPPAGPPGTGSGA